MSGDAHSKVPVTSRDYFSEDPFFKDSWKDFDRLHEAMMKESDDLWQRFNHHFLNSARCLQPISESKAEEGKADGGEEEKNGKKDGKTGEAEKNGAANGSSNGDAAAKHAAVVGLPKGRWIFPRHFMLPSLADQDIPGQLDLYRSPEAAELIRYKEDDGDIEISLDTHNYKPEELHVRHQDGVLQIEGKHEETSKDGSRVIGASFSRKYSMPKEAKMEDVLCNLSSDGVLVVHVPKKEGAKEVEIKQAVEGSS